MLLISGIYIYISISFIVSVSASAPVSVVCLYTHYTFVHFAF